MTTIQTTENRQMISATDFFSLLKTKEDFVDWICRRVYDYKLEFGYDFHIFISEEAAIELARYETFRDSEAKKKIQELIS